MKKISIIILNWNGQLFLEKYFGILKQNSPVEIAEIIVADNASTDNSITWLSENHPEIRTIILDKNYGFAGGYNKAIEQIEAEYFLLLNSDVEVGENWLNPLLELMDSDEKIGVCGPKLLSCENKEYFEYSGAAGGFIDTWGYPFCRGRIFETCEKDIGQYNEKIECFWISGAALMIRSSVFNEAGMFDDAFFAHQEEIDLCWRVQNLGYKIVCEPKSFVYHVGGGTLPKSNPFKTYLNFRNNLYLIEKNIPRYKRNRVKCIRLVLDSVAFIRILLQGKIKEASAIIKAYFHFWQNSKKMSNQRKLIKPKAMKYLKGYYNSSIVFGYYLKSKKKFSDL